MAQTKRKRKHRGTQAGTIERPGRTGRGAAPKARTEARGTARQRRAERFDKPPTWRGALNRALLAAGMLAVLMAILNKNVVAGVVLGILALVIYVPMSYATDRALYNRRQRQKARRGG